MAKYVALSSDTDCDGTTYCARVIEAASKDEAWKAIENDYYSNNDVLTMDEFLQSETFTKLDARNQSYFKREGYVSLGASWNPWVHDDTIGIPALDSTYDEPMKGW